jgi:hypothetical protein
MAKQTYNQYKKEQDSISNKQGLKRTINFFDKKISSGSDFLAPGKASNLPALRQTPNTLLSKEQRMLQAMFAQKGQFWGNGEPVNITGALTTGNGLIKSGDGGRTRRLILP